MSARFEPRIARLLLALERGVGSGDTGEVRAELGLKAEADDEDVARSLVQILSACTAATLGEGSADLGGDTVDDSASMLVHEAEVDEDAMRVDRLDDVRTLLALLRAGRLPQRRAALARMVQLAAERSVPSDAIKTIQVALQEFRDVELDYELAAAREGLPGAPGREARAEREAWNREVATVMLAIKEFWETAEPLEPISRLPGEIRAQLLLRTRDLPGEVVAHLGTIVEGYDDEEARAELLSSLRHAGDPRLVPALVTVLEMGEPAEATEAARALRRVDDPRARPALARRYERSVHDTLRAVVGGALADHGDARGLDYVRGLLAREDPAILRAALEALESLGGAADTEAVGKLLEDEDARVSRQAVRTLARIGDARAFKPLHGMAARSRSSALRAELEDAHAAVSARLDLRGEEAPEDVSTAIQTMDDERPALGGKRIASWWSFLLGQIWLAFGAVGSGLARLERAAALRPGWSSPYLAMGLSLLRRDQHAQALGAFRRAIEADRRRVERSPLFIRAVARCFLARAEQLEREARVDVARGLVGEALALDLRWASGPLRFELERRRDALRRDA